MKKGMNKVFYLADGMNGGIDITTKQSFIQSGNSLKDGLNTNLRSIHAKQKTPLKFTNKSNKNVKINWINYQGKQVTYMKKLAPGKTFSINTFATHPWALIVDGKVAQVFQFLTNKEKQKTYTIKNGKGKDPIVLV